MTRVEHLFMVILVIALLALAIFPWPVHCAEPLAQGQPAPAAGIFFDLNAAQRLLENTERCDGLAVENRALDNVVRQHEALDAIYMARDRLYKDRIAFLDEQARILERLNGLAIKNAEDARKAAESQRTVGQIRELGLLGIVILILVL
jgi:hypothetical protein